MVVQDRFPHELLDQPISNRVNYFRQYTMAHPILLDAAQTLMQTVREPAGISLVFVFGPTGVGKSTLLRRASQKLTGAMFTALQQDQGRIPMTGIEAATPEFGQFDWKDFYLRALAAVQEPFIHPWSTSRLMTLKLRLALEHALRKRQLQVFYIDEAQNFAKVASARKLSDQTDAIKSLANLTGVQFVLTGTYDVLMLRNLSAQLCRRSIDIHFPRYRTEISEDLQSFRGIVQTFQRHLPFVEEPNLLDQWEFCYERSLGCVGILKDWLSRALVATLEAGAKTLTSQTLERHAWSLERCMIMLTEAREEEKKLEVQPLRSALRVALGLETAVDVPQPQSCPTPPVAHRRTAISPTPKRYPVGGKPHD